MRIAYVCTDRGVPPFGQKGGSIHVQEMLRVFVQRGHDVMLLARSCGGPAPAGLSEVFPVELPQPKDQTAGQQEQTIFALNEDVCSLIQSHGPFDLVYERFSLWNHGAMEYASASGTPSVLEVNAPLIEEQARHRRLWRPDLATESARRAFAAAGAIAAVSQEVASWVRTLAPTRASIHVVSNGVCPQRFCPEVPAAEAGRDKFTVGFVGSLRPWHALGHFIDAYRSLHEARRDTRLLIVGDGPQGDDLQRRIAALPAATRQTVHWCGAVAPHEIPGWLASMDVAVAPYAGDAEFYFSPLKVFEYMAAGRAVVASRVGQLADLLQHGQTGLLADAGDASSLAEALVTLYDRPELVQRMGSAARAAILQGHTWSHVADRVLEIARRTPEPAANPPERTHVGTA